MSSQRVIKNRHSYCGLKEKYVFRKYFRDSLLIESRIERRPVLLSLGQNQPTSSDHSNSTIRGPGGNKDQTVKQISVGSFLLNDGHF
jgi:hypothetical protein